MNGNNRPKPRRFIVERVHTFMRMNTELKTVRMYGVRAPRPDEALLAPRAGGRAAAEEEEKEEEAEADENDTAIAAAVQREESGVHKEARA